VYKCVDQKSRKIQRNFQRHCRIFQNNLKNEQTMYNTANGSEAWPEGPPERIEKSSDHIGRIS
jgi:hypothetical protein